MGWSSILIIARRVRPRFSIVSGCMIASRVPVRCSPRPRVSRTARLPTLPVERGPTSLIEPWFQRLVGVSSVVVAYTDSDGHASMLIAAIPNADQVRNTSRTAVEASRRREVLDRDAAEGPRVFEHGATSASRSSKVNRMMRRVGTASGRGQGSGQVCTGSLELMCSM